MASLQLYVDSLLDVYGKGLAFLAATWKRVLLIFSSMVSSFMTGLKITAIGNEER